MLIVLPQGKFPNEQVPGSQVIPASINKPGEHQTQY
jgi:hypothetical protein